MPTWTEVSLWLDARGMEAQEADADEAANIAFRLAVAAHKEAVKAGEAAFGSCIHNVPIPPCSDCGDTTPTVRQTDRQLKRGV